MSGGYLSGGYLSGGICPRIFSDSYFTQMLSTALPVVNFSSHSLHC